MTQFVKWCVFMPIWMAAVALCVFSVGHGTYRLVKTVDSMLAVTRPTPPPAPTHPQIPSAPSELVVTPLGTYPIEAFTNTRLNLNVTIDKPVRAKCVGIHQFGHTIYAPGFCKEWIISPVEAAP